MCGFESWKAGGQGGRVEGTSPPTVIQKDLMVWKFGRPADFKCLKCGGRIEGAAWKMMVEWGALRVRLVVCEGCSRLSAAQLIGGDIVVDGDSDDESGEVKK